MSLTDKQGYIFSILGEWGIFFTFWGKKEKRGLGKEKFYKGKN